MPGAPGISRSPGDQAMARLSMLADMMGDDLDLAVDRLLELGVRHLDLKKSVYGRTIEDLSDLERTRLAALIDRTGVEIYSFSSTLGLLDPSETDESSFRRRLDDGIDNLLATLPYVRPRMIRLLACSFGERAAWVDSNDYLEREKPWVYGAYRDAIERIHAAGSVTTIENEPKTIFSSPEETIGFFERLGVGAKAGITWDIQNMWQSGTYPTLDVYLRLKPVINYVHLKGGRGTPEKLTFRAPLESASWPVREIVGAALANGVSPVLCLNGSHGAVPESYPFGNRDDWRELIRAEAIRDVAYLRATFQEIQ
jgi:sugar phosphate isomerase/epimerase